MENNTNENNNTECVKVCNELLRGEISAIEAYEQALEKFSDEPESVDLRRIMSEHIKSANELKNNIKRMGGEPSEDSGSWGSFVSAIVGSAKLIGENAALGALKQGEEHGKKEYESALENEDVMTSCKSIIQQTLLPRVENHITTLNQC